MKRPKFLYHASNNKNIKILKPMIKSIRDKNEGPVVFATDDKVLATTFIVDVDDTWANMGIYNNVVYFVCADEKRFKKADKGGAVYLLNSNGFNMYPDRGMGDKEWVNKNEVRPIAKVEYESGLKAMLESGVKVLFVSMPRYKEIVNTTNGIKGALKL